MQKSRYYLGVTSFALSLSALAGPAWGETATDSVPPPAPAKEVFSTGVARGRDILDAAISTSSLKAGEIDKLGALSLGEVLRDIPGLRVESSGGEGMANITIRGLPLAQSGSKFMQIEENGLPVLEFGDITMASPDAFLRTDLNLASIEAIRGGSASTFASNSPGGVINLIDKTGEANGGSVQASTGLTYGQLRTDFDYGGKLGEGWRFHVGGFYRQGEGPRAAGFNDALMGGQLKANITRSFDGGYVRLYAKYLNDRTLPYMQGAIGVSGTDADPHYTILPGFDPRVDSVYSGNIASMTTLNAANQPISVNLHDGLHVREKSVGLEGSYNWGEWNLTEKFRFAARSTDTTELYAVPSMTLPAGTIAYLLGGPGATLSYATGPNAGGLVDPLTLNGNGLLMPLVAMYTQTPDLDSVTNDVRASRVWHMAGGELTTTAGFYFDRQSIAQNWLWNSLIEDVAGDGQANLINITSAGGVGVTQNGVYAYDAALYGSAIRNGFASHYTVNAPYGSLNFHLGRLSVGASIRYDHVSVRGSRIGGNLDGGTDQVILDILNTGTTPSGSDCAQPVSSAECRVGYFPAGSYPVAYSVGYTSYSAGANYRLASDASVFARYSVGGRAGADRLLFLYVAPGGQLSDPAAGVDYVHQTEVGAKYRHGNLSAFVTGFLATATEHNFLIDRAYRAYGVEFEGAWRHGPFSLTAGATWTHARITADLYNPGNVGNTPHHQPKLLFQATPQYETRHFAIGANIEGTGSSYTSDTDALRMPGYTVVSPFVQVRPAERVLISLNCNNVFNTLGITEVSDGSLPGGGVTQARVINGRTVTTSLRVDF